LKYIQGQHLAVETRIIGIISEIFPISFLACVKYQKMGYYPAWTALVYIYDGLYNTDMREK